MTPMTHPLHLDLFANLPAAQSAGGLRPFHAVSPRLRASLVLRRLALENARVRTDGANRRANHDVRHAA
jgi:hypothetical protein